MRHVVHVIIILLVVASPIVGYVTARRMHEQQRASAYYKELAIELDSMGYSFAVPNTLGLISGAVQAEPNSDLTTTFKSTYPGIQVSYVIRQESMSRHNQREVKVTWPEFDVGILVEVDMFGNPVATHLVITEEGESSNTYVDLNADGLFDELVQDVPGKATETHHLVDGQIRPGGNTRSNK